MKFNNLANDICPFHMFCYRVNASVDIFEGVIECAGNIEIWHDNCAV